MAAYPTFMHLRTGSTERDAGIESVRATNGALRSRCLYVEDKADFNLVHFLTAAQKTQLDDFYAAEKLNDVVYTDPSDGRVYTVRFASAPQPVEMTPWWEVRVRLRQV